MDAVIEAKVSDYLQNWWRLDPVTCVPLLEHMRSLARVRGFEIDERFADAGLGGGPEASVASAIVNNALGGGGTAASDYEIRNHLHAWLSMLPAVQRGTRVRSVR